MQPSPDSFQDQDPLKPSTSNSQTQTELIHLAPPDRSKGPPSCFKIDFISPAQCESLLGVTKNHVEFLLELLKDSKSASKVTKDQLVATLMIFKTGLSFEAVSTFFLVDPKVISKWFEKTIYELSEASKVGVFWIPKEKVQARLPNVFKKNTRAILDCCEVDMSTPDSKINQQHCFSMNKGSHTMKFMIACSPCGVITFISQAFSGCSSDSEIFNLSKIKDLIEPNDLILGDKGFMPIQEELHEKGAAFDVIPPEKQHFVKRVISRMKYFKILRFLPKNMFKYVDHILLIIAFLCNLFPDLLDENE